MPGTMVQEYPVLSQNVPLGTGTLYARTGIEYHRSDRNRLRACAYPVRINRSRVVSTPHGIPGGRQVIPQVCGYV